VIATAASTINAPDTLAYWSSGSGDQAYLNRISFQDVDSAASTVTVILEVNNSNDEISATSDGSVTVAGSGTEAITLTGTIAAINAFIQSNNIVWDPTGSGQPSRTLTVTIDDNGSTAGGNTTTKTIAITHSPETYSSSSTNNANVADTNINGQVVNLGDGNNVADSIITSWAHGPSTADTQYQGGAEGGGSAVDTITLVFQASQLESILNDSTLRGVLDNLLDGDSEHLDFGSTSWNATVDNFEDANLALAAGPTGYVVYSPVNSSEGLPGTGAVNNSANTVIGDGDNETLNGGAGNNDTNSNGNDILLGMGGDDELWGGAGADLLLGGSGNDELHGGNGSDVLSGGAGADTFFFSNTGGTHQDYVVDYSFVEGDKIDLSSVLSAAFGANFIPEGEIANYVRVTQSGNDVTVQVDTNGTSNSGGITWSNVAVLSGYGTGSINDPVNIVFDGLDHTFKV
jgi:Ca2+-binding RTX toxin-like protein